jgi:hypothetical protein
MADRGFDWRPEPATAGKSRARLAAVMLAACVAAGAGLGWLLPVDKLVVAIERNGVPPASPGPIAVSETLPEMAAAAPTPAPQPERAPQVVVINRATPQAGADDQPSTASPDTRTARRSADAIGATRQAPPITARHRDTSDRRVLVVVRRKGPPYDTKVLRGRIANGRLIVDNRGLVIR